MVAMATLLMLLCPIMGSATLMPAPWMTLILQTMASHNCSSIKIQKLFLHRSSTIPGAPMMTNTARKYRIGKS